MKQFVLLLIGTFVFLLVTPVILAQAPCTPLFGGGAKEDGSPYCMEDIQTAQAAPTKAPTQQSGFTTPNDNLKPTNQTKGGFTVQSAPSVNKQPNTGPEMLGLLGLIPAAATGWYLRKKTTR